MLLIRGMGSHHLGLETSFGEARLDPLTDLVLLGAAVEQPGSRTNMYGMFSRVGKGQSFSYISIPFAC